MKLLRENLFYVVLVVCVAAVSACLLTVQRRISREVDELLMQREQLAHQLARLDHAPFVNEQVIAANRQWIELSRAWSDEVIAENTEWSRSDYRVLKVPKYDGGKSLGMQDGFPIDEAVYSRYAMRYYFTLEYRRRLQEMIDDLRPTAAPSQREVLQAQKRIGEYLEAQRKWRPQAAVSFQATLVGGGRPSPRAIASTPAAADTPISERARTLGFLQAKIDRASQGRLYADMKDLNAVFAEGTPEASDTDLWEAQLHLWIMSDVLAAIDETIAEALKKLGRPRPAPTVVNSVVKHLVAAEVVRGYITYPGGIDAVATSTTGLRGHGPQRLARHTQVGRGRPQSLLMPEGEPRIDNLTERVSCRAYDVKHYSFTVIMVPRFLPRLLKKLMARNYHTVLDFSMEEVAGSQDSPYYYGPSLVMRVTVKGELLLRTDWERRLMPAEVLRTLQRQCQWVLRDEDRLRLRPRLVTAKE